MFFNIILYPVKLLLLSLVYIYKFLISPLLPNTCIYTPTCSTYMIVAIKRFGVIKGTWLGIKRIMRCRPGKKGGFDPVPDNIKGDFKWLI